MSFPCQLRRRGRQLSAVEEYCELPRHRAVARPLAVDLWCDRSHAVIVLPYRGALAQVQRRQCSQRICRLGTFEKPLVKPVHERGHLAWLLSRQGGAQRSTLGESPFEGICLRPVLSPEFRS